jgi:hypothetical protein
MENTYEYLIDTPTVTDTTGDWHVTGTIRRDNLPNLRLRVTLSKSTVFTQHDAIQTFAIAASKGYYDEL